MESSNKMKVELLEGSPFLKRERKYSKKFIFDKDNALIYCGRMAGVCYNKENFKKLKNESPEKSLNRARNVCMVSGHHSPFDHVQVNINLENIPKILIMALNNEHQYTTSEKSARYTPIVREEGSIITTEEECLYKKWMEIFKIKIKEVYGNVKDDKQIEKLAQENSRYLVTVFAPMQLVYSTTFRQINYIFSWMRNIINKKNNKEIIDKLIPYMKEFIGGLNDLNILEEGLQKNEKGRSLSLFAVEGEKREEYFGDTYSTNYKASFAQVAQAQRHRTLDYEISLLDDSLPLKERFFIPPIIEDDQMLVEEWLQDMNSVAKYHPQGELVYVNERGKFEDFILKCQERLCSFAQLETCNQTRATLMKYKQWLEAANHPLKEEIAKYTKGARCTFPNYQCQSPCGFKEGQLLKRKI